MGCAFFISASVEEGIPGEGADILLRVREGEEGSGMSWHGKRTVSLIKLCTGSVARETKEGWI